MKKKLTLSFAFKLFLSTLRLSAFTIGGGYVIVPLMKKQFVDKLGWLTDEEMLDYISIAQSCPGAMAVNASLLVGYRLAGIPGAAVTLLGTVTPPLLLLSLISLAYTAFAQNETVKNVLLGMQAAVCAIMLDVVLTMGAKIIKSKSVLAIIVMVCAFAAISVFNVNVIYVILAAAFLGIIISSRKKEGKT